MSLRHASRLEASSQPFQAWMGMSTAALMTLGLYGVPQRRTTLGRISFWDVVIMLRECHKVIRTRGSAETLLGRVTHQEAR